MLVCGGHQSVNCASRHVIVVIFAQWTSGSDLSLVHRSPVVAAASREVLIEEGHSVIIVEISKLHKDYVREVCFCLQQRYA